MTDHNDAGSPRVDHDSAGSIVGSAVKGNDIDEHAGRPPLFLIFAITVTGILGNTLVIAPLPDILREFDRPTSHAGWLTAAATLPGVFIAPIIGLLADRYGRRMVLTPCLAIFGITGLLGALAPTFELLLLSRLGQGVGSAALINLAVVLIGDHWSGVERTRLLGLNSAVLTGSITVLPAVGGLLTEWGGSWRWSFVPYGLALLTAGLVWVVLTGGDTKPTQTVGEQVRAAVRVLKMPPVALSIGIGFVVFALIFGLFLTVMPILLDKDFLLPPAQRGLWLSVPAIGSTAAALLLGITRKRLGSRWLLAGGLACMAGGFATIGLAGVLPMLAVGSLLYGLGEGSTIPTLQDIVSGVAPAESRGAVIACWVSFARGGQTLGPLACSAALGVTTPSAVFLGGFVLAIVVLAFQIGVGRHLDVEA